MKTIYFIFSDTGTWLSRAIKFFATDKLNHTSIAFDDNLEEVYSFGRIQPKNPFSGGFVQENIVGELLRDADCAIYSFKVSAGEYEGIRRKIKEIEVMKSLYRYNFIGLLGILFNVEINRQYAFFCSQFVAYVTKDIERLKINKPLCFATPGDIRDREGMDLIYCGKLGAYRSAALEKENQNVVGKEKVLSI